ncbi:SRPBCC domain-containing protein [Novosphingobium aquimarinum]|uniref:SRPBCC domain-containing protein n=1 Tax=Novosphingobium aquimarinum TaxID=2682494 RepID=UPI0012EB89CD|nr:SRPBCC domain-containing protein [Novosphingobium aquimarinum]
MAMTPFEPTLLAREEGAVRPQGVCLVHEIEIAAPPELVWDFIADFEGWDAWNPLYVRTAGKAEIGQTLRFTAAVPGLKPRKAQAQVYAVIQDRLLEYGLSNLVGLLKAFRFVEIDEITPTRCRVSNGEIMAGPVGRLLARGVGEKVRQGLEAMNLALKQVAERKWLSRPV